MTQADTTTKAKETADIAIVGGGPAALVLATALARRNIRTTVFVRDLHPERAPRFNTDRSYTIDISGHGLRALRHIDACSYFDDRVNRFKGIKILDRETDEWTEPGWTGSRGDILRALMALITDKYSDLVTFQFESRVTGVDVHAGALTQESKSGNSATRTFDFIIGGDGAGSIIRSSLLQQVPGFTTRTKTLPMYCTMIELDRVGDQLDKHYLHMFTIRPFSVAGAIRGDHGPDTARWFCAVCTKEPLAFSSALAARGYIQDRIPRVLELASEESVAAFAERTCHHIGKTLTCSQFHGGKTVLLGDAAAPFPPIGQGLNAALESAMMLDICIGQAGQSPAALLEAAQLYNTRWKPEADAVSWISERHLAENRFHFLRVQITSMLGLSVAGAAKRSDISYAEVKRKAQRFWPLWT